MMKLKNIRWLLILLVTLSQKLHFPLQFSANVTLTAHQIPFESEYPPRTRRLSVYYDYFARMARIDIMNTTYEADKIYIRRYDLKKEYMVRLPPLNDCKRSYLGEIFPFPDLPASTFVSGDSHIEGIPCNYVLYEDGEVNDPDNRIHMYMSRENDAPVRLILESVHGDYDNQSKPMLTFDYTDVTINPPNPQIFSLPEPFLSQPQLCDRHVAGFPYIHIFHYFVKV
jgi:hypothetical protein